MADFLLEIGCEEIPARMIDGAEAELARRVGELLTRERLSADPKVEAYSTPRRVAVLARGIKPAQPDIEEQVTGPAVKVAFKDGQPGPAAHAFAKKVGVDVAKLDRVSTPKGEYLAAKVVNRGRSASEVLAEALPKEIAGLYWAKNMYWREGKPERFVRPVRWLVAMLDAQVVPVEFGGIESGRESRGHRILGREVSLERADSYAGALSDAKVVATRSEREQRIRKALDAATREVSGARWREDKALLDTVVNLTESPSAILGNFEREYLTLPEEVLVTVMRDHQKYFAVEDASGKLAPHFLAVLNTDGDPEGIIRHGNERVLRARFNDARFFWDTDQKVPLKERVEMLKKVTFQKDLGSYYEKALRMRRLTRHTVDELENSKIEINEPALSDAASLAKTDLTTELVKEFTELQGIVGGLYARAQGLDSVTADAIYDHYKPESMEDAVPRTIEGAVLSIVDKADSIAGMFALGLQPTGSRDPFALRRQANGIVKILAEHKLPLSVTKLFVEARASYKGSEAEKKFKDQEYKENVAGFLRERLEFYFKDVLGLEYDTVNAVLAAGAEDVPEAVARARAVSEARKAEDFQHIAAAFKRVKNILRQAEEKKFAVASRLDPVRMGDETAFKLVGESVAIGAAVEQYRQQKNYDQALRAMATLRPHVDAFFDKVMVMVDDEKVRSHRLAMLRDLLANFSTIADFSEIVTEGKSS
ncbi:MAG: glycine--tRNA ligase subunit beta [Acidobacteriia bacterium]|nr:glycine--tRNA ligase subunit beta [Terriglobia bacterium]